MNSSCRIHIVLVFALIFSVYGQASGQKRGDIYFGAGFPELSNISVRYKVIDQIRTGLSVGWLPHAEFDFGGWDHLFSFSGDVFYHFGRISFYPDMRLFYLKTGVNCILQKPYLWSENWWNTYFKVGGEVFSKKNFGVTIEGGFVYNLNPERNWAHLQKIMPGLGAGILYRF